MIASDHFNVWNQLVDMVLDDAVEAFPRLYALYWMIDQEQATITNHNIALSYASGPDSHTQTIYGYVASLGRNGPLRIILHMFELRPREREPRIKAMCTLNSKSRFQFLVILL
jgi:hypothetical protein